MMTRHFGLWWVSQEHHCRRVWQRHAVLLVTARKQRYKEQGGQREIFP